MGAWFGRMISVQAMRSSTTYSLPSHFATPFGVLATSVFHVDAASPRPPQFTVSAGLEAQSLPPIVTILPKVPSPRIQPTFLVVEPLHVFSGKPLAPEIPLVDRIGKPVAAGQPLNGQNPHNGGDDRHKGPKQGKPKPIVDRTHGCGNVLRASSRVSKYGPIHELEFERGL